MPAQDSLVQEATPEYDVYSYDACSANCVLTLTAQGVEEQERAPVACSFVLDISGSMHGSKMTLMKKASEFSLRQLSRKDYLGLLAFGSEVHNTLSVGPVVSPHRTRAEQELAKLQSHSCTNLAGGLFAGIKQQLAVQLSPPPPAPAPTATPPSTETSANGAEPSQTTDTTSEAPAAGPPGEDSHQPSSSQPIRSVFLFTDGRPTVGLRDAPSILQVMGNMLSPTPADADAMLNGEYEMSFATGGATTPAAVPPPVVKVHTFGFGQDSDPALLGAIADAGSGSYYYISNPDDIPAAFADALGGLLSVAAQNVALRVSPANGARVTGVRSGFPTTRDGPDFLVRVPDVYAEEVKDLVVAVELPSMHGEDVAEDCEFTAATVSIEFIDTVRSRPAVVAGEVRVRRSAEAEAERAAAGNLRVRAQVTRLNAMDSMLQAMSLADRGDYGTARTVLHGIEEGLQSLAVSEAPDDSATGDEAAAEVAAAAAMVQQMRLEVRNMSAACSSRSAYDGGGRGYSKMVSKSHATQRSTYMPSVAAAPELAHPALRHTARRSPAVAAALPPAPGSPGARPRSASGEGPETPTKKSRVKMFLNQMTQSFRRSSRDGSASEPSAPQDGVPQMHEPAALSPQLGPPGTNPWSIPEDAAANSLMPPVPPDLAAAPDVAGAAAGSVSVYSTSRQTALVQQSRSMQGRSE